MKLATLQAGQFVETGGYYTKGDAGQAKYLIVAAQAADNYGDHTLANGTVAVLQVDGSINANQWGVLVDNTGVDNVAALQSCIDNSKQGQVVKVPAGEYEFSSGITLTHYNKLEGDSFGMSGQLSTSKDSGTVFNFTSTISGAVGIQVTGTPISSYIWSVGVRYLTIVGVEAVNTFGVSVLGGAYFYMSDVVIRDFETGLYINYGMTCTYERVQIQWCSERDLWIDNGSVFGGDVITSQKFISCYFRESKWGVEVFNPNGSYGLGIQFQGCLIESTTEGGMNIHKGMEVLIVDMYTENVPVYASTPNGEVIRAHIDGGTTRRDQSRLVVRGGTLAGANAAAGYVDSKIINVGDSQSVIIDGVDLTRARYAIKADALCSDNGIKLINPTFITITDFLGGDLSKFQGTRPSASNATSGESLVLTKSIGDADGNGLKLDHANHAIYTTDSASGRKELIFGNTSFGTDYESARLSKDAFFKASNNGLYGVPNVIVGSEYLGHQFVSNQAKPSIVIANNLANATSEAVLTYLVNETCRAHLSGYTDSSGTVYRISANGDIANKNNVYGAISDVSLKENIVESSSQWDDVMSLQFKNYNLIGENSDNVLMGLISQDVEQTSPSLVYEMPHPSIEDETIKGIKYSILYLKAAKALQEAMIKIESLEARVDALEV